MVTAVIFRRIALKANLHVSFFLKNKKSIPTFSEVLYVLFFRQEQHYLNRKQNYGVIQLSSLRAADVVRHNTA